MLMQRSLPTSGLIWRPSSVSKEHEPRYDKQRHVVSAFVLIQTEMDKAGAVAAQIASLEGVVLADVVTGPYDVIAKAEADDMDQLGKLVMSRMQMIEGITRTLTSPVVNL